jgi:hypothetical protein
MVGPVPGSKYLAAKMFARRRSQVASHPRSKTQVLAYQVGPSLYRPCTVVCVSEQGAGVMPSSCGLLPV